MQPVTIVTGGVRGIGLAFARRAHERGDRVHVTYRSSDELAARLEAEFEGRVHRIDHEDSVRNAEGLGRIAAAEGRVDTLVHCVGEYLEVPLSATDASDLERMFRSNVMTALAVFEALREELGRARGSCVFLGCAGLEGMRGKREAPAYAAAKTALIVLARSLALEEAPRGVRVNVVSPGIVPHDHAAAETLDERRFDSIPLGRPGTPDDVADALLFLTSEAASYTTGCNLEVSGGWPA